MGPRKRQRTSGGEASSKPSAPVDAGGLEEEEEDLTSQLSTAPVLDTEVADSVVVVGEAATPNPAPAPAPAAPRMASAPMMPSYAANASSQEMRSCEGCRRGKLKCSRTFPCAKCVDKGIDCVYEQDKRRGPKPGYIEEIYRRIDTLEQMVIGQSLLLRESSNATAAPVTGQCQRHEGSSRFEDLIGNVRTTLLRMGRGSPGPISSLTVATTESLDPGISSSGQPLAERHRSSALEDDLAKMREIYRTHFQPWIPVLRPRFFVGVMGVDDEPGSPSPSLLEAIIAASGPFLPEESRYNRRDHLDAAQAAICDNLLRHADIDTVHGSVIIEFLLMGDGRLTEYWGLVSLLPQLILRAGLHLEDQYLTVRHHEYRRLTGLHLDNKTWRSRETSRRLFWIVFLMDHFAAFVSGAAPSFDSAVIRRQLPCEGSTWLENREVHTREFITADTAVQVQITPDANIGGLAYLIEATEILAMVNEFASGVREASSSPSVRGKRDMRGTFKEFLNLDLIMANWKARLPTRFQHASPNQDGYIDHNITLAHLTHNTGGILLYQSLRDFWAAWEQGNNQSSALSYLILVKQAAKEISKICARFLLHRRYIVSPQFCLCQFIAARALLAYSRWFEEPLDQDFETITSSLSESSKRWNSAQPRHHDEYAVEGNLQHNDFAAQLLTRLKMDANHPELIDMTTSWTKLWAEVQQGSVAGEANMTTTGSVPPTTAQAGSSANYSKVSEMNSRMMPASLVSGTSFGQTDEVASLFLSSAQFETLDDRIFSWKDYENLTIGQQGDPAFEAEDQQREFSGL